jgi:hypothetical protein
LRGRFGTQSRDTSRGTKSGGRQPAVDVVTASATRSCTDDQRVAAVRQLWCCRYRRVTQTTAGLRQPLLMHDAGALKKTTFAVHNRMFPRAAGINPPCFAIRTLAVRINAFASRQCTGYLACNQERRASARRGCGNRVCNGVRARTTSGSPLCGNCGVAATGALHKPRLAYASRS